MKFKKEHGDEGSADAVSAEEWRSTKLQNLFHKFCADDLHSTEGTSKSILSCYAAEFPKLKVQSKQRIVCVVLFKCQ